MTVDRLYEKIRNVNGLTDRMVTLLAYYNDHTNRDAYRAVTALRGQMTGTNHALLRRGLVEPSTTFPYTALTPAGRRALADTTRTEPR